MIDIVQLKEKGIAKYLKTHIAAIEGLEDYLKKETLVAKKNPIVAQDWNTIKEPGSYAVNGATGLNRPAGAFNGNLLVQQAGGMNSLAQFFIGNDQMNSRRFSGSTWSDWQTVSFTPQQTPLWSGAWYGGASGVGITLSKPISQCQTGIVLQWQEYSSTGEVLNSQFSFTFIPKQHMANTGARGTCCIIGGYNNKNIISKYLYISDTKITGNDVNTPATFTTGTGPKQYVLVKIWEV